MLDNNIVMIHNNGGGDIIADERRQIVVKEIHKYGKVEIDQLADQLKVSPMTIRRDLALLEEEGKLIRSFGGAVSPQLLVKEMPFSTKETHQGEQKSQIALKAVKHIKNGQTILLDSGTTTLELAKLLKEKEDLTIITNDIKIAAELIDSKLKVIMIGGEMQNDVGAVFGAQASQFIKKIHVDTFFLGAHAVDINAGVTSPSYDKSYLKQQMMTTAESIWLLADASKLNTRAFSFVCNLSELTGFITDDDVTDSVKNAFNEYVKVL